MAEIVRICPSPNCGTVERKGHSGWEMYCPKCGGKKIHWQKKGEEIKE